MKNPKIKDYTFTKGKNLFNEDVIIINRNSDKKHIISIGIEHVSDMTEKGYDQNNKLEVLKYLQRNTKLLQ